MRYTLKTNFYDSNKHRKNDTFIKAGTDFYKNVRTEALVAFEIVERNPGIFEPIPEPIEIEGEIITERIVKNQYCLLIKITYQDYMKVNILGRKVKLTIL